MNSIFNDILFFFFKLLLCNSSSSRKEITIDLMFSAAKLVSCWVLFFGVFFLLQARCRRQSPSSYLGCHCGSRGATFS